MAKFKKLRNGGIIFILKEHSGQVHAIPLSSKNLRIRNYRPNKIEPGWDNIDEVRDKFNAKHYSYTLTEEYGIEVFEERLRHLQNMLFGVTSYKKSA